MDEQHVDILERYITVSADFYPVVSTSWGIERKHLTIYNAKNIQQAGCEYNNLLNFLEAWGSKYPKFNRTIHTRVFDLSKMRIWRDPYFYIHNSISGITVSDTFEALFEDALNIEVVRARINFLPEYFAAAVEQLSDVDIPKLDCLRTMNNISAEHEQNLNRMRCMMALPNEDLLLFDQEINTYYDFLKQKLSYHTHLIQPIGEEHLTEYIYNKSGVRMNFGLFLTDLTSHLQTLTTDVFSKSSVSIPHTDIDFMHELSCIIEHGVSRFPISDESVLTLQCRLSTKDDGVPMRNYGYFHSNNLSLNRPAGAMMYSPRMLSKSQAILCIIHEWYPGHHYSRIIRSTQGYKDSIILENPVFEEGWAKYCEYYYAHTLFKDPLIMQEFNKSLVKSILLAIAVILIHVKEMSLGASVNWLNNCCSFDKETLKNICIQAYFSPLESISYILGFYSILSFAITDELMKENQTDAGHALLRYESQMENLIYDQVSALLHEGNWL